MKQYDDRPLIGKNMVTLRKMHNMTIRQLAQESGVSSAAIARIETGKNAPRYETLEAFAAVFGLKPRDLLRDDLFRRI